MLACSVMPAASIPCFVTCPAGLEEVLAGELRGPRIRAEEVSPGASGVAFRGDRGTVHRANLWLRTGIRVLEPLARGRARDPDELYAFARTVDWPERMDLAQTFSVEARVRDSGITHSKYASLRVKDALCDAFREREQGRRPNVRVHGADLPLFLSVFRDRATIYRDTSGETLHKRGYRDALHKSSLSEVVAAAMLRMADWRGDGLLVDPMCGAGTIAIEAALIRADKAPGLLRARAGFPFERWPDHDPADWRDAVAEAEQAAGEGASRTTGPARIFAADAHGGALSLAIRDARRAGVADLVHFARSGVADLRLPERPAVVVTNPPWGERLTGPGVEAAWADLRRFLKERCAPGTAWILSGSSEITRHLGLKAARKIPVRIGKVDARILRYDILPPRDGKKPSALRPRIEEAWRRAERRTARGHSTPSRPRGVKPPRETHRPGQRAEPRRRDSGHGSEGRSGRER